MEGAPRRPAGANAKSLGGKASIKVSAIGYSPARRTADTPEWGERSGGKRRGARVPGQGRVSCAQERVGDNDWR